MSLNIFFMFDGTFLLGIFAIAKHTPYMELVAIPDRESTRQLPFFLALEEWLARKYPGRDFFFMWQVQPTVIIGRHQLLQNEVNIDFCKTWGIDIVRRKSGGGAVIADMNNIMLSYITTSDSVTTTFSEYTSAVVRSLRILGLDATDNSRNDILIGDRKVSGNSYYRIKNRSIVHGTMLYDFDPVLMNGALTPPSVKLQSHGVKSVRSRVTTIREQLPGLTISNLKEHFASTIPDEGIFMCRETDMHEIEAIEKSYRNTSWLMGKNPKATLTNTDRIDGVGTITVHLTASSGIIRDVALSGDFLSTTDNVSPMISELLTGLPHNRDALRGALSAICVDNLIPGLKNEALINLIC